MIVLGLETSSAVCSVGIVEDDGRSCERAVVESRVHSDQLITLISQTLEAAHLSLERVDTVAISAGPGSFTGLRIGMSAAKGLCKALKIPLVSVPTFEAVACGVFESRPQADRVTAVVDAKRDDFYITTLEREGSRCRALSETAVVHASEIRGALGTSRLVCTDGKDRMRDLLGPELEIVEMGTFLSGVRVAALGRERALSGKFADVGTAEPLYLKDFVLRRP